jgi:hypothetical protein
VKTRAAIVALALVAAASEANASASWGLGLDVHNGVRPEPTVHGGVLYVPAFGLRALFSVAPSVEVGLAARAGLILYLHGEYALGALVAWAPRRPGFWQPAVVLSGGLAGVTNRHFLGDEVPVRPDVVEYGGPFARLELGGGFSPHGDPRDAPAAVTIFDTVRFRVALGLEVTSADYASPDPSRQDVRWGLDLVLGVDALAARE